MATKPGRLESMSSVGSSRSVQTNHGSRLGKPGSLTRTEQSESITEQTPLEKKRALRPITQDLHHQDSLFGNSFQAKSFFVVHPEWLSEHVDNTDSEPLNRPPWPWEQPRYRQNIQIPIAHDAKDNGGQPEAEVEEGDKRSPPPLPYALPRDYTFAHPGIDETRPDEKTTCFGAPVVDTSIFKLGY